jgi:hypothetical protein
VRWQAPEASTPWDDDEDDIRRDQAAEARLARYEDDPDGQERDWHDRNGVLSW